MSKLRKWEDLEFDCLVNLLGRVGMKSLLLDVPFVCKSWHGASLNPACWQHIHHIPRLFIGRCYSSDYSPFTRRFKDEYQINNFYVDRFMGLITCRGFNKFAFLDLSRSHGEKYLQHLVEKCPGLKSVSLGFYTDPIVSKFIGKWKQLEEVRLKPMREPMFDEILAQLALNCNNLNSLVVSHGCFRKEYALSIVKHLPKIKKLRIKLCYLDQEELEIILRSCKELEYLDVSKSKHTRIWEEEKLKQLASHIKTSKLATFGCCGDCWDSDFEGECSASESDPVYGCSDSDFEGCSAQLLATAPLVGELSRPLDDEEVAKDSRRVKTLNNEVHAIKKNITRKTNSRRDDLNKKRRPKIFETRKGTRVHAKLKPSHNWG